MEMVLDAGISNEIIHFSDGQKAIDALFDANSKFDGIMMSDVTDA